MKTFDLFLEKLEEDEAFKDQYAEVLESNDFASEEERLDALVAFAHEKEYEATVEDFVKHLSTLKELSTEDMEGVSGGYGCEALAQAYGCSCAIGH